MGTVPFHNLHSTVCVLGVVDRLGASLSVWSWSWSTIWSTSLILSRSSRAGSKSELYRSLTSIMHIVVGNDNMALGRSRCGAQLWIVGGRCRRCRELVMADIRRGLRVRELLIKRVGGRRIVVRSTTRQLSVSTLVETLIVSVTISGRVWERGRGGTAWPKGINIVAWLRRGTIAGLGVVAKRVVTGVVERRRSAIRRLPFRHVRLWAGA